MDITLIRQTGSKSSLVGGVIIGYNNITCIIIERTSHLILICHIRSQPLHLHQQYGENLVNKLGQKPISRPQDPGLSSSRDSDGPILPRPILVYLGFDCAHRIHCSVEQNNFLIHVQCSQITSRIEAADFSCFCLEIILDLLLWVDIKYMNAASDIDRRERRTALYIGRLNNYSFV